jgi:hypothetical protein
MWGVISGWTIKIEAAKGYSQDIIMVIGFWFYAGDLTPTEPLHSSKTEQRRHVLSLAAVP